MASLTPLALSVAPELARWLLGEDADRMNLAIVATFKECTGTEDPDAAGAILQRDPNAAAQLRLQLTKLAVNQSASAHAAEVASFSAGLRADVAALGQNISAQKSAIAWSAPIVSAVVLLTFGTVMALVLTYGVPVGNENVANMLLGTLAAMATSVVSYWVGSSAGSARKDERLAQTAKSSQ